MAHAPQAKWRKTPIMSQTTNRNDKKRREFSRAKRVIKEETDKTKLVGYLRTRWEGGGWGEEGLWRRFKYPPPLVVVLGWLDESLSALTTRRSTRTVVQWIGAVESSLSLSLTWTFIHLSRFRFPHCKTKSDDVVCLTASEHALNGSDPSPPPPALSLALELVLLLWLCLVAVSLSLSICFCTPVPTAINSYFIYPFYFLIFDWG